MRTRYRIDDYQQTYFAVDSFEDLLKQTVETDFAPLYCEMEQESDLEPTDVLVSDVVFHTGTQDYAKGHARR